MNQARTTYQLDYTPFGWLQNNFIPDTDEFCCPENVDECLKYISEEFRALGYPSIYSDSSDCPFAVNCDIVKFLNVAFELLRSNNRYVQTKEDLESRNQRLCSDLNAFNKKNSQLKNSLEQSERKLAAALERERQLKEKNEQLSQFLKSEKDETKKLAIQLRQQKISFQHEIKKYQNNINHIKAKLNQILSDKNPNKKIANISTSQPLPRNTGQRGKWKTASSATTATEDMYNSVISSYETRYKDMCKELNAFHQCLESVLLQIFEIISVVQDDLDGGFSSATFKEFILSDIKSASRSVQTFEDKFKYLLCVWKETASGKTSKTCKGLEDELIALKSKVSEYEKIINKPKESSQVDESQICMSNTNVVINKEEIDKSLAEKLLKKEKMKLEEERLRLSKTLETIEKEKAEICAQKIDFLRQTVQQRTSPSCWHPTLTNLPSVSVINSPNEEGRVITPNQLKFSLSSPDPGRQANSVLSPEWDSSRQVINKAFCSKSDTMVLSESRSAAESPVFSPSTPDIIFPSSDLPSWAINSEGQSPIIDDLQNTSLGDSQYVITDELPYEPSSEEINLQRLKAAVEDIEKRRANIS